MFKNMIESSYKKLAVPIKSLRKQERKETLC